MKHLTTWMGLLALVSCGPTGNSNQLSSASQATDSLQDEEVAAPLGLTGLGDRICRLNYSFVKKDAAGSYSSVGDGSTTDNVPRGGYGRGCLNFCIATFDELMKNNQPNGVEVLIKSCSFADQAPAAATAPAAAPAPAPVKPAVAVFQAKIEACKVVQADQVVIFAEPKTRVDCSAECTKREQSNPGRRCEWGREVLRQHPMNQCIIRGAAGKLHYQQTVTRFQCRMECQARKDSNPGRSCLWGGQDVKGL